MRAANVTRSQPTRFIRHGRKQLNLIIPISTGRGIWYRIPMPEDVVICVERRSRALRNYFWIAFATIALQESSLSHSESFETEDNEARYWNCARKCVGKRAKFKLFGCRHPVDQPAQPLVSNIVIVSR